MLFRPLVGLFCTLGVWLILAGRMSIDLHRSYGGSPNQAHLWESCAWLWVLCAALYLPYLGSALALARSKGVLRKPVATRVIAHLCAIPIAIVMAAAGQMLFSASETVGGYGEIFFADLGGAFMVFLCGTLGALGTGFFITTVASRRQNASDTPEL